MLKERDLHPQFRNVLLGVLERIAPLQIRSVDEAPELSSQSRADLSLRVTVAGEDWHLLVECKRLGHPGTVRTAILQVRSYLETLPEANRYGILMAPFFSREAAQLCEGAGIGYVDLAGNARLAFGPVYIETRAPDNPFREQRADRPLFTPKAGRVLRVLLSPPLRAWKVMELQRAARVSLGHVSTVRQNLLERGWAEVGENGLQITKPEKILRAWQVGYTGNRSGERKAYTLLHGSSLEAAVSVAMRESGDGAHAVYASYSAARWLAPYARQATQFFYADADGVEALERNLGLESAVRGENVVIWAPREDDVFAGRVQPAPGVWCTGGVQTWLDLATSGSRGEEAADHLLQEVLIPGWQGEGR